MTKAQRAARQARNLELARKDAANRCAHCKAPLRQGWRESFLDGRKFCSDDCYAAAQEVTP